MNPKQLNIVTQLQSGLSSVFENSIADLSTAFDTAMNEIVETSTNPKKEGEENFRKLDDLKEEFKRELKEVFEKFDKKLNSL